MRGVLRREIGRILSRPIERLLLGVLPVAAFALTYAIFAEGVPRDLPVAAVDADGSALSRQLLRMMDQGPTVRIAFRASDPLAAERLILEGRAYAYVLVPAGFERSLRRGTPEPVVAYYNSQFLVPGSLVRRDLLAATSTLSAGVKIARLRAAGETAAAADARFEPIRADLHALFNPHLNYVYYLFTALFPTLLHIFVLVAAVNSLGSELREGTAGEWLGAAKGSLVSAIVGKLLPSSLTFLGLAMTMILVLFRLVGVPFRGRPGVLVLGTLLFILAYQAVGVLIVAVTANLRFGTSVAAFIVSPAFAYTGVTFPTIGMTGFARFWGALLPLTHYLRLLIDQAMRGAPASVSGPDLLALAAFVVIAPLLAWPRLRRVVADARYWGRP